MTLGEISPSSASSAKSIGQKHQLVILGEISPSGLINVNFIAFKFTVSICQFSQTWAKFPSAPPDSKKGIHILMS